jgi:hypothetical protein
VADPRAGELGGDVHGNGGQPALADVVAVFRKHLHVPDPIVLYVVLATVIANRITEGDPVWIVIVGGSSRGKTEILIALSGYEGIRIVGSLTAPALLSGTSRKERAANAKGGILREIGARGVLVVKDLGAILAMQRDSRVEVLQGLRETFDGRYTRDVGIDGGTTLVWEGHAGLIGAATSALDRAHAVLSALGERWLTVRVVDGGEEEMAKIALRRPDTAAMRVELRQVVHSFLNAITDAGMRAPTDDEEALLVALASLVCLARSPVERDGYSREIVLVHEPEGPTRLVRQLHKLLVALELMHLNEDEICDVITRSALDSIPSPRRESLLHLLDVGEQTTAQVATTLGLPTRTAERALEELTAHTLLTRRKKGDAETAPNLWSPSPIALHHWRRIDRASPEMSETPFHASYT